MQSADTKPQLEQVRQIMAQLFQVDPERITPELKLNDLKAWDSLGHMSLMMQLEQKLGVEVNEESIIQCTSVAGILELLSRKDA